MKITQIEKLPGKGRTTHTIHTGLKATNPTQEICLIAKPPIGSKDWETAIMEFPFCFQGGEVVYKTEKYHSPAQGSIPEELLPVWEKSQVFIENAYEEAQENRRDTLRQMFEGEKFSKWWHDYANDYAEPGYYREGDLSMICLGDWNDQPQISHPTQGEEKIPLSDYLELMGAEIEWSDEWTDCVLCGKVVRTQGDSYQWQPYHWYSEEEGYICGDCIKEYPEDYIEAHIGKDHTCLTLEVDLEKYGWVRLNKDFESGWYPGQNDDPKKIAKTLKEQGINYFLFTLDSKSQFDLNFSVWLNQGVLEDLGLTAEEVRI